MKIVQAYKCDHCGRLLKSKHGAARHEKVCSKNPVNDRACFDCVFLGYIEHIEENYYSDSRHKVLFCHKKEQGVYPPRVERSYKGAFELGDYPNEAMPKTCELRKPNDLGTTLNHGDRMIRDIALKSIYEFEI